MRSGSVFAWDEWVIIRKIYIQENPCLQMVHRSTISRPKATWEWTGLSIHKAVQQAHNRNQWLCNNSKLAVIGVPPILLQRKAPSRQVCYVLFIQIRCTSYKDDPAITSLIDRFETISYASVISLDGLTNRIGQNTTRRRETPHLSFLKWYK